MKKLIAVLLLVCAAGVGCSSNRVFVHALEPPKWPVAPNRTIGVVAVLAGKQGRNAHLTRDLAAAVTGMLKHSAYYSDVKSRELPVGNFKIGKSGERLPLEKTVTDSAGELGVELLLFVEVLDSKMRIDLGGRVGYSVGFGRMHGNTAFGTSFGTGSSYWNARARMLVGLSLVGTRKKSILARTVEGHSFYRSYTDSLPSESDVFAQMVKWASSRTLSYIDVFYHPSPRYLISNDTKLVADGIHHALLGRRQGWDTARHLWSRAYAKNPDSLAVNYNLGVAAEIREAYSEALSHYRAAREISLDENAFAREMKEAARSAQVLDEFGPPEEAKEPQKQPAPEEPAKPAPQK